MSCWLVAVTHPALATVIDQRIRSVGESGRSYEANVSLSGWDFMRITVQGAVDVLVLTFSSNTLSAVASWEVGAGD